MKNWIMNEESGQGMVEYALIIAFISIAAVSVMGTIGNTLKQKFQNLADAFPA